MHPRARLRPPVPRDHPSKGPANGGHTDGQQARRGQNSRRAAGCVSAFLGVGFGLPCVFGIRHFAQTGQVWTFMGFPTYGDGPLEDTGVPTSTGLVFGFLIVCIAEVVLATMLWRNAPHAAAVSYALLPFEFVFWIGFALPVGPPLGIARTALVLAANQRDRRTRARQTDQPDRRARTP